MYTLCHFGSKIGIFIHLYWSTRYLLSAIKKARSNWQLPPEDDYKLSSQIVPAGSPDFSDSNHSRVCGECQDKPKCCDQPSEKGNLQTSTVHAWIRALARQQGTYTKLTRWFYCYVRCACDRCLTIALHQRQRQSCSLSTLPHVLSHTAHLALTGRLPSNHWWGIAICKFQTHTHTKLKMVNNVGFRSLELGEFSILTPTLYFRNSLQKTRLRKFPTSSKSY